MLKKLSLSRFSVFFAGCILLSGFNSCKHKTAKVLKPVAVTVATPKPISAADTVKAESKHILVSKPASLNSRIFPQFKWTYKNLLKKIFTKMQKEKEGDTLVLRIIPMRNLEHNDYDPRGFSEPDLNGFGVYQTNEPRLNNFNIEKLLMKSSGKPFIVLICKADFVPENTDGGRIHGVTVVALFDPQSGKLLDAADARDGYKQTSIALSPTQDAVVIVNCYTQAEYNDYTYSLITPVHNKLRKVFDFSAADNYYEEPNFNPSTYDFTIDNTKQFGNIFITLKSVKVNGKDPNIKSARLV
jgi:hypothetical protein